MIEFYLMYVLSLFCPTDTAWVESDRSGKHYFPVCGDENGENPYTAKYAFPGWNPLSPMSEQKKAFDAFNDRAYARMRKGK